MARYRSRQAKTDMRGIMAEGLKDRVIAALVRGMSIPKLKEHLDEYAKRGSSSDEKADYGYVAGQMKIRIDSILREAAKTT